jgi:hypothetical protein
MHTLLRRLNNGIDDLRMTLAQVGRAHHVNEVKYLSAIHILFAFRG